MSTFPAALLWLPSPHGAAQGNGNKAAAEERWELSSAEQELCSHGRQLNLAHTSSGSSSSMNSKEAAGGISAALLTLLCAAPAAAWHQEPPWWGITQPSTHHQTPSTTIISLCSTISITISLPLHSCSPPFSLQEKLSQADHSHRRAVCNSTKQMVPGASQITKCEGYAQSSMCQVFLYSLERPRHRVQCADPSLAEC